MSPRGRRPWASMSQRYMYWLSQQHSLAGVCRNRLFPIAYHMFTHPAHAVSLMYAS